MDDSRESPAFELMELLIDRGAIVSYNDPHIPILNCVRRHTIHLESVALTHERLVARDCILIVTDHHAYDWEFVVQHSSLVVDTRGVTRKLARSGNSASIVSA